MDNASKALIMAGGILTALLIIGILVLMFNQISTYKKTNTELEKTEKLSEFNYDFERYVEYNTLNGTDLITLGNKIIDYNKKAENGGVSNSPVDYNITMTLTVSNLDSFRNKYGYTNKNQALFKNNIYVISANDNTLKNILDIYNSTDRELLQKLSSIYSNYNNENQAIKAIKESLEKINPTKYKNWNGNNIEPTLNQIKNFKEYSEFKTSTFKLSRTPEYENGQIKNLYFEFVK